MPLREARIEKLTQPKDRLRPKYSVVVVGSGYGGGVAASRLARAGERVCVIERGREIPVGSFPDRASELMRDFQTTTSSRHFGSPTALFDYRVNSEIDILMGCGLGGTSLINANVCLKPDPRVFEDEVWPEEVRADGLINEGFVRARAMLQPKPTPEAPDLLKREMMKASAEAFDATLVRPPLHIAFEDRINAANVMQPACTLCGDCCAGCNVGAKTTVQMSYLADAFQHGAEIFTELTVRWVHRRDDGLWQVTIRPTMPPEKDAQENGADNDITVVASTVVLAAGTLGTTEILLRSRDHGLELSDQLGHNFTGNGDALSVGYNCDQPANNVGVGHPPKVDVEPVGPAVAGMIDLRGTQSVDDGIALVEAALPGATSPFLPITLSSGHLPFGDDTDGGVTDELNEFGRALQSLVMGSYSGAVRNSQAYLGIGHDNRSGHMTLENDRIKISWPAAGAQPVFKALDEAFHKAIAAVGGSLLKNPLSKPALGGKLTSVHPLGGCIMASDRREGVINHKGQVFNGAENVAPSAVHSGLYVCDGAALPRSVGIHPLFTITALAERTLIHMARDLNLSFDVAPRRTSKPLRATPVEPASRKPSWQTRLKDLFGLAGAHS